MEVRYKQLEAKYERRDKAAYRELKDYLRQYPYTTYEDEVHFMMGALQTERGVYKQALKDLGQVRQQMLSRPHAGEYLFYTGYANLMLQEYQRANLYFDPLRKMDSDYRDGGAYYYAYCLYRQDKYEEAIPVLSELEHNVSYRETVPYYLIQSYYALHDYEQVQMRAEQLLAQNPQGEHAGEVHRILGEIYYQQGDYAASIHHLQQYAELCRKHGNALVRNDLYLMGLASYRTQDYTGTISSLKQVKAQQDAVSENTYLTLGHAYRALGQMDQARLSYQSCVGLGITPEVREEAMFDYTLTTYESSTALGESVVAFTNFLSEYPQSSHVDEVYQLMSDALRRSKNYAAALEALSSIANPSRKMKETMQYLRYQLGTDAFLQGNMQSAERWMTDVICDAHLQTTQGCEAYYWRAEARYRLHNYAAAETDVRTYLSNPKSRESVNYVAANYLRAYTYFSQAKYTEAEGAFTPYIRMVETTNPTYADALNRLGDCAFNARRFEPAIGYYQQVIQLGATGSDYATFQKGYAEGLLHRYTQKVETMQSLVTTYPNSDYADDALYEMARAQLQLENDGAAIAAYEQLLATYPHSDLARRSCLELAMLYRNGQHYERAIAAYKRTIDTYPGSEEAYAALSGLESVYVETNNIAEYLAYTKQLGKLNMAVTTKEDSLCYAAAELQYALGNYREAAASLTTYLSQYCAGGRYCTTAQYYAADSYYRLGQTQDALVAYQALAAITANPYMEEACTRAAEISYDSQDYTTAMDYFYRMLKCASTKAHANTARLGVLRCSYYLGKHQTTIDIATQLIDDLSADESLREEARFNRAKAYIAQEQYGMAVVDLTPIAAEVRTAEGAEAKYRLAECYYHLNALDNAEEEIMSFAGMNTQHQYWLAKALILLADINHRRGDDFQARQYLLSLQANYKQQDDIQEIVAQKLAEL